jgi:hypothetical protein
MVDEETIRQHMDIAGEEVLVCDRCGKPYPRAELEQLEPESPLARPIQEFRYCQQCREQIERGDVTLELEQP